MWIGLGEGGGSHRRGDAEALERFEQFNEKQLRYNQTYKTLFINAFKMEIFDPLPPMPHLVIFGLNPLPRIVTPHRVAIYELKISQPLFQIVGPIIAGVCLFPRQNLLLNEELHQKCFKMV